MQCPKCSNNMDKKNTYDSGNIKFQRWQCGSCWGEHNEAVGLTNGMPDWG